MRCLLTQAIQILMKGWDFVMGKKSRFSYTIQAFHESVTGSCILVTVCFPDGSTNRFIVDCGNFQGKDQFESNFNFGFNPEKVDFALITHNHTDHTARLPLLVKKGFNGPIYTSHVNTVLLPPALVDSAKVLKSIAKLRNEKVLYSEGDVKDSLGQIVSVSWNKTVQLSENINATFFRNGHILGASLILVEMSFPGYENIYILFTGDYSPKNTFFDVPELPKWVRDLPLTVVIESTYGNKNSNDVQSVFKDNIISALNSRKIVMCPVFSQGRAQEVLYCLKMMQNNGDIDTNIPIYLDGNLAIKYTEKYKKSEDISPKMRDFLPENFSYVTDSSRDELLSDNSQKIILSSSGMGSYGPAQIYIPELLSKENALIHFTGYCAEGTLGRKLMEAKPGTPVVVGGRMLKKMADVRSTSEFSAHAKADELIELLHKFKDIKMVLVNHGEPEVKEIFAERVLDEVSTKNIGILGGEYAFRLDRYGYVKSLSV